MADNESEVKTEIEGVADKRDYQDAKHEAVSDIKHESVGEIETGEFVCPECGKKFDSERSLAFHRLRSHRVPLKAKRAAKPSVGEEPEEEASIPSERDHLERILKKFRVSKPEAILSLCDAYGFSVPCLYAAMKDVGESLSNIRGVLSYWSKYRREAIPEFIREELQPSFPDWESTFGYGPSYKHKTEFSEAGSLLHGIASIIKAVKPDNANAQPYAVSVPENPELTLLRQENQELRERLEKLEKEKEEEKWRRLEEKITNLEKALERNAHERDALTTTVKETADCVKKALEELSPALQIMVKEASKTYKIVKAFERAQLIDEIESRGYKVEEIVEEAPKPPENRQELPPEDESGVAKYVPDELIEEG